MAAGWWDVVMTTAVWSFRGKLGSALCWRKVYISRGLAQPVDFG